MIDPSNTFLSKKRGGFAKKPTRAERKALAGIDSWNALELEPSQVDWGGEAMQGLYREVVDKFQQVSARIGDGDTRRWLGAALTLADGIRGFKADSIFMDELENMSMNSSVNQRKAPPAKVKEPHVERPQGWGDW